MFQTFLEAVRATTQPCTFLLLAPTLATIVVVRAAWWALAATVATAIAGGWVLAANSFVLFDGPMLRLSAAAVAATSVIAAAAPFDARLAWATTNPARSAIAGGNTLVATQWWRPCVGEQLGRLLTGAQSDLTAQLPGLAVYMVGAMVPVLLVVLAAHALAVPGSVATIATATAAACSGVIAGALLLGRHDSVVVTLTRWTQS